MALPRVGLYLELNPIWAKLPQTSVMDRWIFSSQVCIKKTKRHFVMARLGLEDLTLNSEGCSIGASLLSSVLLLNTLGHKCQWTMGG